MTKIVLAPDKFKGFITGMEFCEILERRIRKFNSNIAIVRLPLADGGDETFIDLRTT